MIVGARFIYDYLKFSLLILMFGLFGLLISRFIYAYMIIW